MSKMRIPFGTIVITEQSKKMVMDCLDRGRISSGQYVRVFEEKFAKLLSANHAVAVSSGTDALACALSTLYDLGAQRGDEVIVPALSFVATGNAVLHAGFKPIFVDVTLPHLTIDVEQIEGKITTKTRAIVPVHLMGKPADMDGINAIAKKHDLIVIEDAAEAFGAQYKGKNIGTLGDMSCFSLYVAHVITTGEGGIIFSRNEQFAEILRSLRSHGRACKCKVCISNTTSGYCEKRFKNPDIGDIRFHFERVGFSSKMNELEAAIGIGALDQYEQIIKIRKHNLSALIKGLKRFESVLSTYHEEAFESIGPHAFPFWISPEKDLKSGKGLKRDDLMHFLEKRGIDPRTLFSSIPTQCHGYEFLGYKKGDFPNAEYIGKNGIHIGVHQDISLYDIEWFFEVIDEFVTINT